MARVWGSLGQLTPAATTLTTLYTVPAAKHAVGSFVITNTSGAGVTVRISHAIAGAADDRKQYMLYDYALAAATTVSTPRITAAATDVLRVYASAVNIAFIFNGVEEDN